MTLDRQWHGPSHGAAEADYNVMLQSNFNPRGVLEVFRRMAGKQIPTRSSSGTSRISVHYFDYV
jgi:hypothetical protein